MTEVLHKLTSVLGGKDKSSSDNDTENHMTPAEQIKEKAITEEESKGVADGSMGTTGDSTSQEANGISTSPEEAHASDIKDSMSSKTDTTANTGTTANGADDNASMIPLGKGSGVGETVPPLNADSTTTDTTGNTQRNNTFTEGSTAATSIIALESTSTSVTRAEIDSAKEAIIAAVANCQLTRQVVFSDTDNGTEDGKAEVKRVISGYKGIDEALAEMNRYIPHHVRDSHDLGVAEGDRIRQEQQDAANKLTAGLKGTDDTSSASATGPTTAAGNMDEKITEKEALASTPTGLPSSDTANTTSPPTGGLTDLQKEELKRVPSPPADAIVPGEEPEHERGVTLGAGVLPGAGAAAAAVVPLSHIEDGKPAEPVADDKSVTSATAEKKDKPDEATILATTDDAVLPSTSDDATTGDKAATDVATTGDEAAADNASTGDKAAAAAVVSPSATSEADKGDVAGDAADDKTGKASAASASSPPTSPVQGDKLADRLKREVEERARRGQLGVFNKPLGTSASTASVASASKGPDTSSTSATRDAAGKEGSASSAFTEEFGPGETGLAPASPTAGTTSTKPPSTRARTASLSSQTSTGEKRGLLGLFRRKSKRKSISDGSTGRRTSQDLGRTVSKDTVSSPVTASAVPPAPSKPVETVDTASTPAFAAKDDTTEDTDKTADPASSGDAASASAEPAAEARDVDDSTGVPRKDSPDDMLGPGAAAVIAAEAAEKEKKDPVVVEKEDDGDMIGPGALANALGETGDSTAPATMSKSTTTAEPSTSEHKVEDVATPGNEVSTQTTHEPAPALGTAMEPVTYVEESAPAAGAEADSADILSKETPDNTLGSGTTAAGTAEAAEKDGAQPAVIDKGDADEDETGTGALASAPEESTEATSATPAFSALTKPATADKSTSTSAEMATSTEEDEAKAAAPIAAATPATATTTAAPVTHTDDDVPMYSKPSLERKTSAGVERKQSKGGFFGLFRRRSSRRSSSGPPQRSVSDISKPVPKETTPPTENHVTPAVAAEETVSEKEKEDLEPALSPHKEEQTPFVDATDPDDPNSDAAKAELARSDTDKEIAHEAEEYSEATIHAYGALNIDELETVEEEMERGPEETVAEPHGSQHGDEEDDERDLHNPDEVASEPSQAAVESRGASRAATPAAVSVHEEAEAPEERVSSPIVAATPAERLLSGERRKSRSGGFFGLFRSRTRKDKDSYPSAGQPNPYEDVVRNVGRVDIPDQTKQHKETRDIGTAMSDAGTARSPSAARSRTRSVTSPAPGDASIIDHGTTHDDQVEEEEEEYQDAEEEEEEIPDNRSITEIAASIPLPAPVYTDKTRAKHERLRKKREREEALERERIRKENEILAKRERIMTAYTGKQDFTKVPKPARTKNFGRAHERKDLDGVQFVNKADKKAAKKDELTKTTSRGSSIDEPSSPSHPASGGLVGSFPADKSYTRVSHASGLTSDPDTEPGSPSPPQSPILKLGRRVSTLVHKREKPVEVAAA